MTDPNLADDLRAAADSPSGIFPAWMSDHMRQEADRIDATRERWARLAETPTPKSRKGQAVTFAIINDAEEPA
ncbi:hypothetical protein [Demequina sp. SO4-18]|uniref:hypothetical protein n=1 Tax=Demequina sp. SO4-18 TaxID=3401026 RepID=UPI003B5A8AAE